MKKLLLCGGVAMIAAALIFGIAACSDGIDGGDAIVISGTLSGGGNGQGHGIAQYIPSPPHAVVVPQKRTQVFRAEVKPDNSIEGVLRDGTTVFLLEGRYDPGTKGFTMQTPSANIIFFIAGKLNADNKLDVKSAIASVEVRDTKSGEWQTVDLVIASGSQSVE